VSEERLDVPAGGRLERSVPASLLVMRSPEQRVAVLYWYQLPGRAVASDHGYRALLLYNRLVHRRADGALVRVAAPVRAGDDVRAIVTKQVSFIQAIYPDVLGSLPR
jgi:EpsI family protein